MAKKKRALQDEQQQLVIIKQLVVIAMFSDDVLLELFVLKGGNALDLIHHISARSSRDVDFSMQGDFSKEQFGEIKTRIEATLKQTLAEAGYEVFDIQMQEVPDGLTEDIADFWGGYTVEFKVIERQKFLELGGKLETIRTQALKLGSGGSTKFSIDISKHEFIDGKQSHDLLGFRVFVYSPVMIVCEKLRAICQQMPEYGPIVKRNRPGSARARDFLDIHTLINVFHLNMTSVENRQFLQHSFSAKRVPLSLLNLIPGYRNFHSENWLAVKDTLKPGVTLETFDFYFDFVLEIVLTLGFHSTGTDGF
jgi:hypothetical protein